MPGPDRFPPDPPGPHEPADRVREEGGSPALVHLAERLEGPAGEALGFWIAVYARFARHRGSVLAGGLAFFALLSIVPAVLSMGAVVAMFLDPAQFVASVEETFSDSPELLDALQPVLDQIAALAPTAPGTLGLAGGVGFLLALYAASKFLYVGRQVLDVAFELEPQHPSLLGRGAAVLLTLVAEVLIIIGVLALALVPRVVEALRFGDLISRNVQVGRGPAMVLVVYLLLTAAMRFGIRARRAVRWLNLGAALGTLLIVLGTFGLGWYLSASTTYSQIVAVLGGVIALEIWLYLIGLAIVGAAEIEGMRLGFRRRDRRRAATPA